MVLFIFGLEIAKSCAFAIPYLIRDFFYLIPLIICIFILYGAIAANKLQLFKFHYLIEMICLLAETSTAIILIIGIFKSESGQWVPNNMVNLHFCIYSALKILTIILLLVLPYILLDTLDEEQKRQMSTIVLTWSEKKLKKVARRKKEKIDEPNEKKFFLNTADKSP